jgi:hypothetical protein
MDLDSVFCENESLGLHQPDLAWDLEAHGDEVWRALRRTEPGIENVVERLRTSVPAQKHWLFGDFGAFTRPDRHARAIYLRLGALTETCSSGGYIGIKGGEAVANNLDAMLARLKSQKVHVSSTFGTTSKVLYADGAILNSLERFSVLEGKPPCVHPFEDALEEAEGAYELQLRYFERYRTLARVPTPLLVFRWSREVSEAVLEKIRVHASRKVWRIVANEVLSGLGVHVYYYPSLPFRAGHTPLPDVGEGLTFGQRLTALSETLDPKSTVEAWIELTSRILCSGYLPTDPTNLCRGYCLQSQNAVIDGGFVDTNSFRKMSSFDDDGSLAFALMRTTQVLSQTITVFLAGQHGFNPLFHQWNPDVYAWVKGKIGENVQRELRDGYELPSALLREFASEYSFSQLCTKLHNHFDLFNDAISLTKNVSEKTGTF